MLLALLVVGCGGDDGGGSLVFTTSFPLTNVSGMGTSPLQPLLGQTISFEVELAAPTITHDTIDNCRTTVHWSAMPPRTASGATASTVQTEILDRLPDWDAKLELCADAASSSVVLHSDNQGGLAVIVGCLSVPAAAQQRDGAGDPVWSSFEASMCDATVYDQLNGPLFTSSGFTMTVSN